jgi:Fanconi anemia group M protein
MLAGSKGMKKFVENPLVRENMVECRLYQEVLVNRILEKGNSLVVAPTALGKTIVAVLLAAERLAKDSSSKVLFVAPTKPLAAQHSKSFRKFMKIDEGRIALFTGTLPPEKRKKLWEASDIVCATPQAVENDIINGRLDLGSVSLLIFDEAHRAVGNYSYVFMAKRYAAQNSSGLIVGLTASPGHERERIQDVCRNLLIKNMEIRSHEDEDVKPYVKDIEIEWLKLDLPEEINGLKKHIENFLNEQLVLLAKIGYARELNLKNLSKKRLIELQIRLRKHLATRAKTNPALYVAVSRAACLLKVSHAHTLVETQGIFSLREYIKRLEEAAAGKGTKADKFIINHPEIKKVKSMCEELYGKGFDHPKVDALKRILSLQFRQNPESRVLVFNHYRDSIRNIAGILEKADGIRPKSFIGQAARGTDKGLKQKEQIKLIEDFRKGVYNVLLCSSVAEEGIDIPAVDLVVFYEPVPSEIRTIQRRGRTGRLEKGKVIMLMAKGTKDEAFYWTASSKERKMKSMLYGLKKDSGDNALPAEATGKGRGALPKQQTLLSYAAQDEAAGGSIVVYADHREQKSGVVKKLMDLGAKVVVRQLAVADYQVSDEIAVERKSVSDFLQSLMDGRLFRQAGMINENFSKPLIIVEGNFEELYYARDVNKKAVIGALSSLLLNYRIPVFPSADETETAEIVFGIAKREQEGKKTEIRLRVGRKGLTSAEKQRFVVESLPAVGPVLAKNLLREFGNIRKIANAEEKELTKVEKMGKVKAKQVREVFDREYKEE